MDKHTMAELIGRTLVLHTVVAELVVTLTPQQRQQMARALQAASADLRPIDAYEPECTQYRAQHYRQWLELLTAPPFEGSAPPPAGSAAP
jgi:uroporphyrinogen-III synthase